MTLFNIAITRTRIIGIIVFVVILVGIVITLAQIRQSQENRSRANVDNVQILFSPSSGTLHQGDTLTVTVAISSGTTNISGVDLRFRFDNQFLQVTEFAPTQTFNSVLINNTTGAGLYRFAAVNTSNSTISGSQNIGTFKFTVLGLAGSSSTAQLSLQSSQITSPSVTTNIPATSTAASYTITTVSASPTLAACPTTFPLQCTNGQVLSTHIVTGMEHCGPMPVCVNPTANPSPTAIGVADSCTLSLTEDQILAGNVNTQVNGTAPTTKYLAFYAVNGKKGALSPMHIQSLSQGNFNTLWNTSLFFDDGPAIIECRIQSSATSGSTFSYSKRVSVIIQNNTLPTATPNVTSIPTVASTIIPTATPIPTTVPTLPVGATSLAASISIPSITSSQKTHGGTIYIFNLQNQLLKSVTIPLTFNNGKFVGQSGNLGNNFTTGDYLVKIKLKNSLAKQLPGVIHITQGQTTQLTNIPVVVGDINNDNFLTLADYNILISCAKNSPPTGIDCDFADLNDDDHVEEIDANVLLRAFVNRDGDSIE